MYQLLFQVLEIKQQTKTKQNKNPGPRETYILVMERQTNMVSEILHIVNGLVMIDMKKNKEGKEDKEKG